MKRAAVVILFASMVAMGVAYAATLAGAEPHGFTAWIFVIAMPVAFVALIALAVARRGKRFQGLGALAIPLAALLVILVGAFALALALPAGEPLVLGLPRRAAIVLYGVGILPVLMLPLAYALTFRDMTLSDEDLDRINALRDAPSRRE